jgi:DNA-binding CsgD family transcriptional regulator
MVPAQGGMQAQILHCLPQAALLVDRDMSLHAANLPAWRMLASGQPLLWRDGQLVGPSAGPCRRLRDALASLLSPGPAARTARAAMPGHTQGNTPGHTPARRMLRLESATAGPSSQVLQLFALCLSGPDNGDGQGSTPGLALLVVHDLATRLAPDPAALAEVFKLTPSETRVAKHIAAGASARQIADHHGVAMSTVRSQIRTVFDKMGVRRQSELVALLAALPVGG